MTYTLTIEISKTFPKITQIMSEKYLIEFIQAPITQLNIYHFGLGLWIRNNLLQPESKLYQEFVNNGFIFTDDMSTMIIIMLHYYLNIGLSFNTTTIDTATTE